MRIAHPNRSLVSAVGRPLSVVSRLRSSFSLQTLALAMAGVSDSIAALPGDAPTAAGGDDELKFGFQRPDMYKSSLAGTVDPPYDRHVFLCYKSPEAWASRVEDSESDLLPKLLASALKSRKNDINVKTRLTICEGGDGTKSSNGDVLIFPEMIKYRGLQESGVDTFVEDVLVNGKPWSSGMQEVLTGSHVFVCAHGSRDRRCGVCGPVLIEKFEEEIEVRGLKDQVFVSPCSHIGGHKYAGNLIIFSPNPDGEITGHWYGYVTPNDVSELIDQHIGKGEIIERLWRGQMGASPEDGEKVSGEKLPNGKDLKKSKKKFQENGNQVNKENAGSCCQGGSGFSCCRDGSLEAPGKKGLSKLSSWVGTWEQGDVLVAVAVVGAVATVGVPYSLYRKSG